MFNFGSSTESHYIRTTSQLRAEVPLKFPDSSQLRFFSEIEATKLAETLRRRNVFARHSGENDFYVKQVAQLSNRTIIELYRFGEPDETYQQASEVAELIELLAVLSSVLVLKKDAFLRQLGINSNVRPEVDLIAASDMKFIRSRSQRRSKSEGILVNKQFHNRFTKSGFVELYQYCQTQSDLARRVQTSADWLLESRREPRLNASVVKTAIALESLLIFAESESLARSLSERAAFILTPIPAMRHSIARIISRFYDARSGVVHGSKKKAKRLSASLVESVDRISLLLYLVISTNQKLWPNVDTLRAWCEEQRWGAPSSNVIVPFSRSYLKNAIALSGIERS
jgi:hypothetical protein